MIYLTGDCHGDFSRFTRRQRALLPFHLSERDYVIVCGDFGLLWANDREFKYNIDWLSRLPFTILWVQGNHENYNMIEEYPLERWNGGASSRDISGGILDRNSYTYRSDYKTALRSGKPFRILNESWWRQELPNQTELEEGINNLEKAGYRVDYVISHCGSNRLQKVFKQYYDKVGLSIYYNHDILTDYFEELEDKLQYKKWFCGHYHKDVCIDEKHIILYHKFVQVESSV